MEMRQPGVTLRGPAHLHIRIDCISRDPCARRRPSTHARARTVPTLSPRKQPPRIRAPPPPRPRRRHIIKHLIIKAAAATTLYHWFITANYNASCSGNKAADNKSGAHGGFGHGAAELRKLSR